MVHHEMTFFKHRIRQFGKRRKLWIAKPDHQAQLWTFLAVTHHNFKMFGFLGSAPHISHCWGHRKKIDIHRALKRCCFCSFTRKHNLQRHVLHQIFSMSSCSTRDMFCSFLRAPSPASAGISSCTKSCFWPFFRAPSHIVPISAFFVHQTVPETVLL